MGKHAHDDSGAGAPGRVIHWAARYDLLTWFLTFGRERAFREKILRLAHLAPGESVLDIGCGTGTTALLAKRQVGPSGAVHGIDASPEMIARASAKARRAALDVTFERAAAQALPLPDARFDVVITTLMLHHLSHEGREQMAREVRRVLKPTGRVLAVDFVQSPRGGGHSFIDLFHRHGVTEVEDIVADFRGTGLNIVASGAVGMKNLQFVLAAAAADTAYPRDGDAALRTDESFGAARRTAGSHLVTVGLALGIFVLIGAHMGAPWLVPGLSLGSSSLSYGVIALVALLVILKTGLLGGLHRRNRKRSER